MADAIVSVLMTFLSISLSMFIIWELRSISQDIFQSIRSETIKNINYPSQEDGTWDLLDPSAGRMHMIFGIGSYCYLISIINPDKEKIYIQFSKYACKRQRLPILKILVFYGRPNYVNSF